MRYRIKLSALHDSGRRNLWYSVVGLGSFLGVGLLLGCNSTPNGVAPGGPSAKLPTAGTAPQLVLTVSNSAGTVYSTKVNATGTDAGTVASAGLNFFLALNTPYKFTLSGAAPAGAMTMTITNLVTKAVLPAQNFVMGANSITPVASGVYSFVLTAGPTHTNIMSLTGTVACNNPSFTKASLSSVSISVVPSSLQQGNAINENLFDLSIMGTNTLDGVAPYYCSFDQNGVSINETSWAPCANPVIGAYITHFPANTARKINASIVDSCGTAYTVSTTTTSANVYYAAMILGSGNNFIDGTLQATAGPAINDPRADQVTFMATQPSGITNPSLVAANFAIPSNTFSIKSTITYSANNGPPGALPYGLSLSLAGFSNNLGFYTVANNLGTYFIGDGSGTLDVSGAYITGASSNAIEYTTDRISDGNTQIDVMISGTPTSVVGATRSQWAQTCPLPPTIPVTMPSGATTAATPSPTGSPLGPPVGSPVSVRSSATTSNFAHGSCTLSSIGSSIAPGTQPTLCSGAPLNANAPLVIDIWGTYSCTGLTDNAGNVINIVNGHFEGALAVGDNCPPLPPPGPPGGLPAPEAELRYPLGPWWQGPTQLMDQILTYAAR